MSCYWHKTCSVFLQIRKGVENGPVNKRACLFEFIYNLFNYFRRFSNFKNSEKQVGKLVNRFSDSTSLLFSYKIVDGIRDDWQRNFGDSRNRRGKKN
jgi:hypothetical protein